MQIDCVSWFWHDTHWFSFCLMCAAGLIIEKFDLCHYWESMFVSNRKINTKKKNFCTFFHFLHRKINHCVRMNRTRYMYKLISTNEKSGITLTFFKKGKSIEVGLLRWKCFFISVLLVFPAVSTKWIKNINIIPQTTGYLILLMTCICELSIGG